VTDSSFESCFDSDQLTAYSSLEVAINDVNNASEYTFLGNSQTFSTISKKTANGRYTLLETPLNATRTIEADVRQVKMVFTGVSKSLSGRSSGS
jgi:hypothetical protein